MSTEGKHTRAALKAQLTALQQADEKVSAAMAPFRVAINAIQHVREMILEAHGISEDPPTCLGCACPILPGDKAQDEASGEIFCEECAYTYTEIKANHDEIAASGLTSELEPKNIEAFAEAYAARIAAGQSVDEKPLHIYGEG